jgi:hypothetical protein
MDRPCYVPSMDYVEEREFLLRLEVRCPFPPDYDGDEDGYAWVESFRPIANQIVQAAAAAAKAHPGWRVRFGNRGRPTDEEVTLILERELTGQSELPQK